MKQQPIAILGSGPAGLLAAHAARQFSDREINIYSLGIHSVIPGSVYLHESIPGVTEPYPDNYVQYIRMGTAEHYAQKVYDDAARNTGWEHYMRTYPSWNALRAYDRLWETWGHQVVHVEVRPEELAEIEHYSDLVISTIPAQAICNMPRSHTFLGAPYWIKTLATPPLDEKRDVVVYNGLPQDAWYRWSVLGGVCSIESTVDGYLKGPDVVTGLKPISNDCDCWPTVVRCGRWAEWRHGILLNHAYNKAVDAVKEVDLARSV
jgi:hypothetical protein